MALQNEMKPIFLTKGEAELIMDTLKVSGAGSRRLVLAVAAMVIEWEAESAIKAAQPRVTHASSTQVALREQQAIHGS